MNAAAASAPSPSVASRCIVSAPLTSDLAMDFSIGRDQFVPLDAFAPANSCCWIVGKSR